MTDTDELRLDVAAQIQRLTIDLNQAGRYFASSQYEGYEKNLKDIIKQIDSLLNTTASKID